MHPIVPRLSWRGEIDQPGAAAQSAEWAHHGIAALPDGGLVTADPCGNTLAFLDPDGSFRRELPVPVTQAHGISVDTDAEGTWLWLADNGDHRWADGRGGITPRSTTPVGQVVKTDLEGNVVLRITAPRLREFEASPFSPTHVVVDEQSLGGSGNVWVCDGYGSALVLCFDREGRFLDLLDGTRGLGRFDQPHGALIDRRLGRRELMVADRGNSRIQVFDLDGSFLRGVGVGLLRNPGHFAEYGDHLFVSELHKRILVLDPQDGVATVWDDSNGATGEFGPPWPHAEKPGFGLHGPPRSPGLLTSPHALAVVGRTLVVAEWLLGGRLCAFDIVEV